MVSKEEPPKFENTITIDFLQRTCLENQQKVEELALSEIYSLELPIPCFNNLAVLRRSEFSKLMANVKQRKVTDSKSFVVMATVICDTLTCCIQGSKLYDNYITGNTYILTSLISLLKSIQNEIISFRGVFDNNQMETLISILSKSSERIRKDSSSSFGAIQEITCSLKKHLENRVAKNYIYDNPTDTGKENYQNIKHLENSDTKDGSKSVSPALKNKILQTSNKNRPKIAHYNITKAKFNLDLKKPKNAYKDSKKPKNAFENSKNPTNALDLKKPKNASEDLKIPKNAFENSKKPKNALEDLKKPKNAFELMMTSSKIKCSNKKLSV